jgi:endogenous inhibitor of DNA gyrase (YacG/DUF329 family)
MNDNEKRTIQNLRSLGKTYRQIADYTDLSENTVKSYCRRNDVSKGLCKNCLKTLVSEIKRKPKIFCGDRCRREWWRVNRDQLNKKAVYHFTCANCARPFVSYGNRNRKFCSRGCYMSHRYGVP